MFGEQSDGCFFLVYEDLWRMFDNSFLACASFFFSFFFFKVEVSSHTLIPLCRPGSVHSGSARWDDCDWVFPDEFHVSSFPDRFLHYAWTAALSAHSDFVWSKMYVCLGVTYHLHFWQNDQGLLHATVVTQGWNGRRIKVSTQSWLQRRKFSCCSCRDSNLQSYDHESGTWTNKRFQHLNLPRRVCMTLNTL